MAATRRRVPRRAPVARRACAALLTLLGLVVTPAAPAQQASTPAPAAALCAERIDAAASAPLHDLLARHQAWLLETFPEIGTYRGDARYGALLGDVSPAAIAAADRDTGRFLAQARGIDRARLAREDRVSLDMFIELLDTELAEAAFPAARGMSLTALGGPQTDLAELLPLMPVATKAQVEQMLARMGVAFPRRMAQEIEQLRRSAAAGWIPGRDLLRRVLVQIDSQLAEDATATPFYGPFRQLGEGIGDDERSALQARAREAITQRVQPALRRLRDLVTRELLPRAPADGALHRYPDGARVYALAIRRHTGRMLTPQALHDIGWRELAKLRQGMAEVMREMNWPADDFEGFVRHLNTDPRWFHTSPEALLDGYRAIAKRIDGELPRLFAELPRAPYAVRAMPAHMGADRAEYYHGPSRDGQRAGAFYASAAAYRTRPIWSMQALVAHEAVPGHHLQIALAQERSDLPEFRRDSFGRTAFVEGWALYAETLGPQLGLYTDPASRFGALQMQAMRAVRLVVDTGLHALGWSRQQAIDTMRAQTGLGEAFVGSEIDRYLSVPGQALAYMVGRLGIEELRDRARERLGARFDLRRFHQVVLGSGALPLATLERVIDEWLDAQAPAAAPRAAADGPA